MRKAFTLIELLIVVAILAVLAVAVVLTLNPAALLQESRDNNRISDMATLNSAISLYTADVTNGTSLGSVNTVYVSIPDPTATSTAGDQCQGLSLPTLPSTYFYQCAASSTFRKTNGTGWIPVNLGQTTFSTPLSVLPTDPTNTSSSRLYYTYTTDGTRFEVTSVMESAKYKLGGSADVVGPDGGTLATVYEKGSKVGLEPLDYGDTNLVGYWTFDEGSGAVAYDYSGNNATGSWSGTQVGTSGFYSAGMVGGWAGAFDGTSTYVNVIGTNLQSVPSGDWTVSVWANIQVFFHDAGLVIVNGAGLVESSNNIALLQGNNVVADSNSFPTLNAWTNIVVVKSNTSYSIYFDGQAKNGSLSGDTSWGLSNQYYIGRGYASKKFTGLIDDVRIYNRALSAAEVQAMYNGGK